MTRTKAPSFQNALVGIDGVTRHLDRIPYIALASLSRAIGTPLSLFYQALCYSKKDKIVTMLCTQSNHTIQTKNVKPN